jgi:hypothetical protein
VLYAEGVCEFEPGLARQRKPWEWEPEKWELPQGVGESARIAVGFGIFANTFGVAEM